MTTAPVVQLTGAVDLHVHGGPDLAPRRHSDIELARRAQAAGMRALVIKSHVESTVGRAALAREATGFDVFGGIVLNPFVTGGLNPDAVEVSLALGARVVWLPSLGSDAHGEVFGRKGRRWAGLRRHPAQIPETAGGLALDVHGQATQKDLRAICRSVARADALLASGHVGTSWIGPVARLAASAGTRFLVTHPDYAVPGMSVGEQLELAAAVPGMMFERPAYVASGVWSDRVSASYLVAAIRATGIDRNIVSSDLGQPGNPPYPDGLAGFATSLAEAGLTEGDLKQLLVSGPRRLLHLA